MGHATHFLERLERLSSPQADFALELYRDSALIRYILEHSRLPDGAERVALGVDQRPGGPHIVVARDGGFVTCLGAGMDTHDLPVIGRGKIEHLGSRYEGLREATERSRARSETRRLYRNVVEKGGALSREDFSALAAMMPIIDDACAQSATQIAQYVFNFQRRYTRSRYRRLNDKVVDELRLYWRSWWAVGHLVALCGTQGPDLGARVAKTSEEKTFITHGLSKMTIYSLSMPVMLRGGWAAARIGRETVSRSKQHLRTAQGLVDVMCHSLSLVVIALRHRGARAEVQKCIARTRRGLKQAMCTPIEYVLADALLERFEKLFDSEFEAHAVEQHRKLGAGYARSLGEHMPEDHPHRYTSIEEVPDELALALPLCVDEDLFRDAAEFVVVLPNLLPWLATADVADFYLPARLIDAYSTGWNQWRPEQTLAQLDALHRYLLRDLPVRAGSRPGRNAPCTCGSGKKYKRCCLLKSQSVSWQTRIAIAVIALILIIGALVTITSLDDFGEGCPLGQVWSPEHGHCH